MKFRVGESVEAAFHMVHICGLGRYGCESVWTGFRGVSGDILFSYLLLRYEHWER